MIGILKTRLSHSNKNAAPPTLGRLETSLMDILWARGESSVRHVFESIDRQLAYTTVMTTLDRLFKKGLLERRKSGRAFHYTPGLTRLEWEQRRAGDLISALLSGPGPSRAVLVSCILDAVGQYGEPLLEELENRIRMKRKEMQPREKR
jgi:predicted transcriptional regulator